MSDDDFSRELLRNVWSKVLDNKEVVILVVSGLVMLGMGIGEWQRSRVPDTAVEIVEADVDSQGVEGGVVIDVSGAVVRPGVYRLDKSARIGEALEAAGGLSDLADQEWVSQNMNLAAQLIDGMKVFVPEQGQSVEEIEALSGGVVAGVGAMNVNSASQSELETLTGVGPARAESIVSGRPYSSVEELISREIIPEHVYEDIVDQISVY